MSDQSEMKIKAALYTAYITSKEFDHADHIEELKNIVMEKVHIREALKDVKALFSQSNIPPVKNEEKTDS